MPKTCSNGKSPITPPFAREEGISWPGNRSGILVNFLGRKSFANCLFFFPPRYETYEKRDAGFHFFWNSTNPGWGAAPETRAAQAAYILDVSCKMQYVVKEAHRLINGMKKKLLVYAHWPNLVWITRLLAGVLQFRAERISAGQTAKERADIIDEFNDPEGSVDLLVCSSQSAAESYNFQKGGHYTIVMEIVNFNTLDQIIGRQYRLGQKHEQYIKVLMSDNTYDQVLVAKYATKMIAQLSATMEDWQPTDEAVAEILNDAEYRIHLDRRAKAENESLDKVARRELFDCHVRRSCNRLFGIRSDKDNAYWADAKQLRSKWLIRGEAEFYLGLGGAVAEEVKQFLMSQEVGKEALEAGQDANEAIIAQLNATPMSKGIKQHMQHLERTQKAEDQKQARLATKAAKEAKKAAGGDKIAKMEAKLEKLKRKAGLDTTDAGTDESKWT